MEERFVVDDVRERLILCGLKELEGHGIGDFSLRRVASMAQVSCAAPYRHFKDKEALILAIIAHVREGWELLAEDISALCSNDPAELALRLSVASARFWIANGNFRTVLLSGGGELDVERREQLTRFDQPIRNATDALCLKSGGDPEELYYSVSALIYGTVSLVACGTYGTENGVEKLKIALTKLLAHPGAC
ncbi:MAG: TetR/AcrR family transcriptional regulator [Clostridia bacterium]|nr:TetR/AcrR family transcriptional regulator [Clostridia bacterium]